MARTEKSYSKSTDKTTPRAMGQSTIMLAVVSLSGAEHRTVPILTRKVAECLR